MCKFGSMSLGFDVVTPCKETPWGRGRGARVITFIHLPPNQMSVGFDSYYKIYILLQVNPVM